MRMHIQFRYIANRMLRLALIWGFDSYEIVIIEIFGGTLNDATYCRSLRLSTADSSSTS
jgi:hypothetical protein